MAFVVESGVGLSNANAYLSVADFKSYHDDRGQSYASYSDSQIQYAIIKATDYLDYRFTFIGIRRLETQSLEWPRLNAFYSDGRMASLVPVEVQEACAEYAFRALSATLAPDPIYDDSNSLIANKTSKVGPLEVTKEYSRGGNPVMFRAYPAVDMRLKELVLNGHKVLRA